MTVENQIEKCLRAGHSPQDIATFLSRTGLSYSETIAMYQIEKVMDQQRRWLSPSAKEFLGTVFVVLVFLLLWALLSDVRPSPMAAMIAYVLIRIFNH
jgi:hypothetical protein